MERVTSLAASVGLNKDDVKAYVNDSGNQEKIWKSTDHWSKKGVQGRFNFKIKLFFFLGSCTKKLTRNLRLNIKCNVITRPTKIGCFKDLKSG